MRSKFSDDGRGLRDGLIAALTARGVITDRRVEEAFRAVPRHVFLPGLPMETAYRDEAIPTKEQDGVAISSSSQPAVMAIMLEQLGLQPGERVLEIGAGTGYNAALMAHMLGPSGHVVTLDIDEDIVAAARSHLSIAGFPDVTVVCRDGALGYAECAPYDRIILTVSSWDIAPEWFQQLRPGGVLVLPLSIRGGVQKLVAFARHDMSLDSISVCDGGFMPLRGIGAGPQVHYALGNRGDAVLTTGTAQSIDPERLRELLTGPHLDVPLALRASAGELWGDVGLWLALHASDMCGLTATRANVGRDPVAWPISAGTGFRASLGVLDQTGLCLLTRAGRDVPRHENMSIDLAIRRFGSDESLTQRLVSILQAWDEAGRPSSRDLHITAYPREVPRSAREDALIVDRPWTRFAIDWRARA